MQTTQRMLDALDKVPRHLSVDAARAGEEAFRNAWNAASNEPDIDAGDVPSIAETAAVEAIDAFVKPGPAWRPNRGD